MSPEQLNLILQGIPDGVTAQAPDGRLIFANDAAAKLCGFSTGIAMLQATPTEIVARFEICDEHGNLLPRTELPSQIALRTGEPAEKVVRFHLLPDGEERWSRVSSQPIYGASREVELVVNVFRDITERQALLQESLDLAENFRLLAESMPQIVWTASPDGQRTYFNRQWFHMTGLDEEQTYARDGWMPVIHPEDRDRVREAWNRSMDTGEPYEVECRFLRQADQEYRWHLGRAVPILDKQGQITKWYGTSTDIHDQKQAQELIRYQAFHDTLTGLPNRKLFTDRLMQTLKQASRRHESVAVLFMDLDRFKNINDTLGHAVGDNLLKETAQRLRKHLREQDTVARLGGDEFVILVSDMHSGQDAIKVARKILKSLDPGFTIDGHKLHITTSIGIALYPTDGEDAATLLKHADTALYRAKEAGRNNYQLFNKTMGIEASERLRLENELRMAISNNELLMYYQPIVDLKSGSICQVESLIRWQHPDLGMVFPNEFIPLAEETGMIVHMASSVFKMVGKQSTKWQKMGWGGFRVGVNLSSRQFMQPNIVERIGAYLKETGLDPKFLELEITESLAMKDIGITIQKLEQLKKLGVGVSIDDFGTGYSSLSYLKRLPIDSVKIDRSFVMNCITDQQDAAIIKAIISMAHSLGLKVIAEGVETEEQREFLATLKCDSIQGYLISKPLPAADFTKFLRKHHGK